MGFHVETRPFALTYPGPIGFGRFLQGLLQDGAAAIAIALIVRELFEREHERRQREAISAVSERSNWSAMKALLKTVFDERMVEELCKGSLSTTLLREDYEATYRISRHPKSRWLVKCEVEQEYTIRNPSMITSAFEAKANVPNYAGIYPHDSGLSPPRLKSATFDGKALTQTAIDRLNAEVAGKDPPDRRVVFLIGKRDLKKNDSCEVRIVYEREKLLCDTELMTMLYPTKGVRIKVQNSCDPNLCINLRGVGPSFAEPKSHTPDGTEWSCECSGLLLQNQGWILYWNDLRLRPSENEPLAGPAGGASAAETAQA